jgi:hypothetical protein
LRDRRGGVVRLGEPDWQTETYRPGAQRADYRSRMYLAVLITLNELAERRFDDNRATVMGPQPRQFGSPNDLRSAGTRAALDH